MKSGLSSHSDCASSYAVPLALMITKCSMEFIVVLDPVQAARKLRNVLVRQPLAIIALSASVTPGSGIGFFKPHQKLMTLTSSSLTASASVCASMESRKKGVDMMIAWDVPVTWSP